MMSDELMNTLFVSDNVSLMKHKRKKQKLKKYLKRKKKQSLEHSGSKPTPCLNGAKTRPPAYFSHSSASAHTVFQYSSKPSTSAHSFASGTKACFTSTSGTKDHLSTTSGTEAHVSTTSGMKSHLSTTSVTKAHLSTAHGTKGHLSTASGTKTNLSSASGTKGPLSVDPLCSLFSSGANSSCHTAAPSKTLAIDCEMVGAGPKGHISQLARCSIVSYDGDIVYDKFIKPTMPVTDYRTRWSGIHHWDLTGATPYAQARKEILKLLTGKVVVGHAIHNDFKVLSYCHPSALIRDTSKFPLLNEKAGLPQNQAASLKRLTKAIFNRDIQTGNRGHSSVEDAKATMELYRAVEVDWERTLTFKSYTTKTAGK